MANQESRRGGTNEHESQPKQSEMTRNEAKASIEKIHREKREKDSADLRALLKILAEELNSKETHFIWELLQNAEDNRYDHGEPALTLRIETNDPTQTPSADGCLVVLNNEAGFQEEHVLGICSAGNSSKKRDETHDYIGEKGIGFKSVFRVTDSPHIFSNGYQFRFAKPETADDLGYILPHWVEVKPSVVTNDWTAILLPLQPGKRAVVAEQLSKIAPESILFLSKLKRLEVGDGRSISRADGKASLVTLHSNGDESLYFVHRESFEKPENITEEKRQGIRRREVTVAFPLKTSATCKGRIFAFLPTEFDSGLPFLVNADFVLKSDRERVLEDRHWNQWLRDEIAPTFVMGFLSLVNDPKMKTDAYRFLPIASELTPGAEFFAPIVGAVQKRLQTEKCILTKTGNCVLPKNAFFAGALASRVLRDAPADRAKVALLHPSLERYWERIKPLGVQALTFAQLFDACNDDAWLSSRDAEWWETLFDLLVKCEASAETVGSFPLLRCRDGKCRPLSCGVFSHNEGRPSPTSLPAEWPAVHLFDADLQSRIQQKPTVWAWLTRVAGLHPFSIQSYITGSLLDWMRGQTGQQLIEATHFIAANLKHLDEEVQPSWRRRVRTIQARQTLRDKMPWLLADEQVILPETRGAKELVTPECLEGDTGWNLLFPAIDRHFLVIHDAYCAGLPEESLAVLLELFKVCGATAFPKPRLRELSGGDSHYDEALARCAHAVYGTPTLRDWAAPGWLLGLNSTVPTANTEQKIQALERWLKALGTDHVQKLLLCSEPDSEGGWQQISAWSEFGNALHTKPWLRTSNDFVLPTTAFLDTQEFREFFGDSVAYVAADIAPASLEKLGVRVHLTAEVLIGRLREMSGSKNPDFALLTKIYRRLQDSNFDAEVFRREELIFLAEPKTRWLPSDKLVWEDAGALFDDDFGYVELTYGERDKSELRRLFNEHLKVPARPELQQYASAWKSLCGAPPTNRSVTEKKIRIIQQRLAESLDELPNCDWWTDLKPHLHIWTDGGRFASPAQVYVPDDFVAVELFTGLIPVAFPPKPNPAVLGFLRWMGCRSLATNLRPKLAGTSGESTRPAPTYLTPPAKELCVLMVCSHRGWQERCSHLQALLDTEEIGVTALTVEYSLYGDPEAGTRSRTRDAHWDVANRRLLLREGVDSESLRDAAAKDIAAAFFGETESAEMQAEFFRLLMVSVERARKLMDERSNWRLNPEQQEWLREQNWQTVITKLDEVEQTLAPRAPRAPTSPPPSNTATQTTVPATTQEQPVAQQTKAREDEGPTTESRAGVFHDATKSSGTAKTQQDGGSQATDTKQRETVSVKVIRAQAKRSGRSGNRDKEGRQSQPTSARTGQAGGLDSLSRAEKDELENRSIVKAIEVLKSHEPEWGTGFDEVEDVHKQNLGYDVLAKRKSGELLRVELKAHGGEAKKVNVTRKEWKEHMRQTPSDRWELWNIEFLDGAEVVVTRHNKIPSHALEPSAYWVDLNACSWCVD